MAPPLRTILALCAPAALTAFFVPGISVPRTQSSSSSAQAIPRTTSATQVCVCVRLCV